MRGLTVKGAAASPEVCRDMLRPVYIACPIGAETLDLDAHQPPPSLTILSSTTFSSTSQSWTRQPSRKACRLGRGRQRTRLSGRLLFGRKSREKVVQPGSSPTNPSWPSFTPCTRERARTPRRRRSTTLSERPGCECCPCLQAWSSYCHRVWGAAPRSGRQGGCASGSSGSKPRLGVGSRMGLTAALPQRTQRTRQRLTRTGQPHPKRCRSLKVPRTVFFSMSICLWLFLLAQSVRLFR